MSRTLIRAISSQAAEGYSAPSAGSFVNIGKSHYVEFSFNPGGSTTGSPTSVTLLLWYIVDGARLVASTYTIANADVAAPASTLIRAPASEFYVTIASFSGGSTPTLTLDVYARPGVREDGRP